MNDDEDDVIAKVTFCTDRDEEFPTVTFCTYGQCADRTVLCPSCTTIEVKGEDDDAK